MEPNAANMSEGEKNEISPKMEMSAEARRDFEMEKLQRERDLLSHELELKAQLYQSEMNLMRQMLAGYKEEREVAFLRITSLEQQKETLNKEAERALELEKKLKAANAEVADLHEALKELEEECLVAKQAELARVHAAFEMERQEMQSQIRKLIADTKTIVDIQMENTMLKGRFSEQQEQILQLMSKVDHEESLFEMLRNGKHIDKGGIVKLRKLGRDLTKNQTKSPRFDTSLKEKPTAVAVKAPAQTPRSFDKSLKEKSMAVITAPKERICTGAANDHHPPVQSRRMSSGFIGLRESSPSRSWSLSKASAGNLRDRYTEGGRQSPLVGTVARLDLLLSSHDVNGAGSEHPWPVAVGMREAEWTIHVANAPREEGRARARDEEGGERGGEGRALIEKLPPQMRQSERPARFGTSAIPLSQSPRSNCLRGGGFLEGTNGAGEGEQIFRTETSLGTERDRERGRVDPLALPRSPTKSTGSTGSNYHSSTPRQTHSFSSPPRSRAQLSARRKNREPSPSPIRSLKSAGYFEDKVY